MKIKQSMLRGMSRVSATMVLFCLISPEGMSNGIPFLSTAGNAQSEGRTQTDEERVRRVYINLQFYHSAGNQHEAAKNNREHVPYDDIDIYIYNTYTGSIGEIRDRKYFDLVSPPTNESIQLTSYVRKMDKDPTEFLAYEAKWVRGRYVPPNTMTVGQLLQSAGPAYSDVEKFTSYEVRVRLDGRERSYKALALFHSPAQSTSELRIEIHDLIMGEGGALTKLSRENRPAFGARERKPVGKGSGTPSSPKPTGKVPSDPGEPDPRKSGTPSGGGRLPIKLDRIDDETSSNLLYEQGHCDTSGVCCPAGATSLTQCCQDPMSKWSTFLPTCSAGGSGGVNDGFGGGGGSNWDSGNICEKKTYYASQVFHYDGNQTGHFFGQHSGSSIMQSHCNVDSSCSALCDTTFIDVQASENGMLYTDLIPSLSSLIWHARGSIDKRSEPATGYVHGSNTPPKCAAAIGFKYKSCIIGTFCDLDVTISGGVLDLRVSTDPDALLNYSHLTTHSCPKIN